MKMTLPFFQFADGDLRVKGSKLGSQTGQGIKLLSPESYVDITHRKIYVLPALRELICGDM